MEELVMGRLKILRFRFLPPGLVQATTTTTGWDGACGGPQVEALARAMGLEAAAWMAQVHGSTILEVGPGKRGEIGQCDGLATTCRGMGLVVRHADCLPIVLYGRRPGVVVALHAGWRGIVKGLPGRGVEWMNSRWGVEPWEVWAGIGPGLGPCCGQFRGWREIFPQWMQRFRVGEEHFDLWEAARAQLVEAGVREENIELAGICTCCDRRLHSYRRDRSSLRGVTIVGMA